MTSNSASLDSIGLSLGTDKSSNGHNYLNCYQHFLQKFRHAEFDMLEIGIFSGASIRMWLEYFPKARIHAVDIDPARVASISDVRYKGYVVDHGDISSIVRLVGQIKPLVLIDDGSHFWTHQIISILHLGPLVDERGVLIVEDLEVNYPPLDQHYSQGVIVRPVDYVIDISKIVLSGGLEDKSQCLPVIAKSPLLYASVTSYKHAMIACRVGYYTAS